MKHTLATLRIELEARREECNSTLEAIRVIAMELCEQIRAHEMMAVDGVTSERDSEPARWFVDAQLQLQAAIEDFELWQSRRQAVCEDLMELERRGYPKAEA